MKQIYKILFLIIFITFPNTLFAHVQHYESLKRIEFDIYRNNKHIGKHIFSFKKSNEELIVKSKINFKIKKLGVVLYKYNVDQCSIYIKLRSMFYIHITLHSVLYT